MRDTLSKKQRGFVKDYIKTGNGTEAALKNYDIEAENQRTVASAIASENLTKPLIVKAIHDALSDELLSKKHLELLEQNRIDYFVFPKYMDDDEIVAHVEDATGIKVLNVRETEKGKMAFYVIADAGARGKALEMAYKIKGSFAPEKHVNLNVDVESDAVVEEAAQKLNALFKGDSQQGDGNDASLVGVEAQSQE